MRECGVKVLTVRDILSYGADEHIGARVELEDLAMKSLTYDLANGYKCASASAVATLRQAPCGLCGCHGRADHHLAQLRPTLGPESTPVCRCRWLPAVWLGNTEKPIGRRPCALLLVSSQRMHPGRTAPVTCGWFGRQAMCQCFGRWP